MLDKYLPPTDSLYKFIAISGLMLIGFSFIPMYLTFQLEKDFIEYSKQSEAFENELNRSMKSGLKKAQLDKELELQINNEIEKYHKLSDESLQQLRQKHLEMNKWVEFKEELNEIKPNFAA